LRWLRRVGYGLAALIAIVCLGTIVPRPLLEPVQQEPPSRRFLLLANPIHTDFALPLDDELREQFAFLSTSGLPLDAAGAEYVLFGWGGRSFYLETPTWSELKPGPLFKGLTADRSAVHIALAGDIAVGDDAIPFHISDDSYKKLLTYIRASFADDGAGAPIVIPNSGYGDFDIFYEAKGTFTALRGCNTWTAAGLRVAGIQTGFWNPLPVLLKASLRLHGASKP
jgi:uncharacterized protein (TIGR02117 family)